MAKLDVFSPEEQEQIVSLFYRVGIYVSHAEDEDGEHDDDLEMKALERVIKAIAKLEKKSEFLHSVANDALARKDQWEDWNNRFFQVENDCKAVVALLYNNIPKADFNRYRLSLIKIGEVVASAYGEFGEDFEEEESFFTKLVDKISGGLKSNDDDEAFMNITPAEDQAIITLKNALKTPEE